jgi:hypothetical protein
VCESEWLAAARPQGDRAGPGGAGRVPGRGPATSAPMMAGCMRTARMCQLRGLPHAISRPRRWNYTHACPSTRVLPRVSFPCYLSVNFLPNQQSGLRPYLHTYTILPASHASSSARAHTPHQRPWEVKRCTHVQGCLVVCPTAATTKPGHLCVALAVHTRYHTSSMPRVLGWVRRGRRT